MKRVIALVLLLSGVLALFTFNVHGATPAYGAYKTNYRTVSPITFKVSALQLESQPVDNTSAYEYEIYIGASVTNAISTACYINDLSFGLNFGDGTTSTLYSIVDMETYSPDLSLSCVNHTFSVIPSNEFSYNNGVVVPANSCLYLVCKVRVRWNGVSNEHTALNSISVYNFTTTTSDVYVPGIPVDYSPIMSYLESMPTQVQINNVLTILSQLYLRNHEDIQALIDILTYTGNNPSNTNQSVSLSSVEINPDSGFRCIVNRLVQGPFVVDTDFEYVNDSYTQLISYRYQIILIVNEICNNTYIGHPYLNINNFMPTGIGLEPTFIPEYKNIFLDNSNRLQVRNNRSYNADPYRSIYPKGNNLYLFTFNVYTNQLLNFSAINPTYNSSIPFVVNNDVYAPTDEYTALRDLYAAIQSSSSSSISSDSNTLNQTESQVHQQEQIYFQQNAQAILDTGLSNYRFNTEQSNGISAVSIDFTSLWNALGSWNSVYIFALTLTIALTILRHAPNAISTARRRNYDHNYRGS